MSDRERYSPGPAHGAQARIEGEKWTLVHVRDLRHPPEKVWIALTEPQHLREWAPFEASASLAAPGTAVQLTSHGGPSPRSSDEQVILADPPTLLEYTWGGRRMRWELEAIASGTRLTLWADIDRQFIAMGAAGWHVCFDVLDRWLDGKPLGRIIGREAMQLNGWQELIAAYASQMGVGLPPWPGSPAEKK